MTGPTRFVPVEACLVRIPCMQEDLPCSIVFGQANPCSSFGKWLACNNDAILSVPAWHSPKLSLAVTKDPAVFNGFPYITE